MLKIPILCVLVLIAFACSTPKTETSTTTAKVDSTTSEAVPKPGSIKIHDISRFPDIQKQNNLGKIVKELENADCVNEKGIGFAAEYTRTYALYERMSQLATEPQLYGLLKNKSAVVRVYAFRALKELKYASANEGKTILDTDTGRVCWFVGCIKTDTLVSFFSHSEE